MAIIENARRYHERMFPGYESKFLETDPEFIELFDNFAFDEVMNIDNLDDRTRMMAILATLVGCQGIDEFKAMLPAALNLGVTPVEAKEINTETRLAAGIQALVDILGEGMKDFWKSGSGESRYINYWLADNCFGDYYTRSGLDYRQREMITFCFLAAQGGCEPQLISHAAANMRIGNEKAFLIKVVSQCLPFIGYPRSLNALRCLNEACE